MGQPSYRISRQADAELNEIADYLAVQENESTIRVLDDLLATFNLLADCPEAGTVREDLRADVRAFPGRSSARNYVVFYFSYDQGVEIATVIHGARDYSGMFSRGER